MRNGKYFMSHLDGVELVNSVLLFSCGIGTAA